MNTLTANLALALIVLLSGEPAFAQSQSGEHLTPLDEALELYQQFSGKTVLRSPNLPPLSEFNKPIPSSDTNGMTIVLENELFQHGIQFIPHRAVFALAVQVGWSNSPEAQYLATLQPRPTDTSPSASLVPNPQDQPPGKEPIPPGTIDFKGADIRQVLDLYSMLVRRTLLLDGQLSSPTFKVKTQTSLTKSGAIYLVEVALALNGIAAADDGTNFAQVVPLGRLSNLKLQAPKRNPDDPLIDPENIRRIGFSPRFKPVQPVQMKQTRAVDELVAYYAQLTDRKSVPSDRVGGVSVVFNAQTPLAKNELLYGLDTTLALSRLAIIEVDDKTIRAGYVHELKRAEGKSQ
jgi:hypothetical protein